MIKYSIEALKMYKHYAAGINLKGSNEQAP
jgi:hypothetical protein